MRQHTATQASKRSRVRTWSFAYHLMSFRIAVSKLDRNAGMRGRMLTPVPACVDARQIDDARTEPQAMRAGHSTSRTLRNDRRIPTARVGCAPQERVLQRSQQILDGVRARSPTGFENRYRMLPAPDELPAICQAGAGLTRVCRQRGVRCGRVSWHAPCCVSPPGPRDGVHGLR